MEHLAIMRKSWNLTHKILNGIKKIESRWYKNRYAPYNKIKTGEMIYFKNSNEPVKIKAEVGKVLQFDNLTQNKVRKILDKYGKEDGIEKDKINYFYEIFKDKKYCLLIFLKNPTLIEPFDVNKRGFGIMSAWITVDDINRIKKAYK